MVILSSYFFRYIYYNNFNQNYVSLQFFLSCLFALSIDLTTSKPIVAPAFERQTQTVQSAAVEFDPNQQAEVEDFIQSNGITGQDIEEYQRMSKLT